MLLSLALLYVYKNIQAYSYSARAVLVVLAVHPQFHISTNTRAVI